MNNIAISSGHGKIVRGAEGILDEVDEARRIVDRVCALLTDTEVLAYFFHDDVSSSQQENLDRIVDFHNGKDRELDVSVHFNAYEPTEGPMGVECLYVSQGILADTVAAKIAAASGLKNRGGKYRDDLKFLNATDEPSILIETCFVDSQRDADLYRAHFEEICRAIAESISGLDLSTPPQPEPAPPSDVAVPIVTITSDPPQSVKIVVK